MMTTATCTTLMTVEELLDLPDDGMNRWLIAGELRQRPRRFRDQFESLATAAVGTALAEWSDARPSPRGQVLGCNVGVWLEQDPDTFFGASLVYLDPEDLAEQPESSHYVEVVPTLVVEIIWPNMPEDDFEEKLAIYRDVEVPLLWIVDPYRKTVTVHRPNRPLVTFGMHQALTAEPHLPGFRVAVAALFE